MFLPRVLVSSNVSEKPLDILEKTLVCVQAVFVVTKNCYFGKSGGFFTHTKQVFFVPKT